MFVELSATLVFPCTPRALSFSNLSSFNNSFRMTTTVSPPPSKRPNTKVSPSAKESSPERPSELPRAISGAGSAQDLVRKLRQPALDAALIVPSTTPSHKLVTLDGYEPARFVFVEERDCIGCTHCATTAPGTFFLEDDFGRARVYNQSGNALVDIEEAIDTCPVNCIYYTTFEDLVALEKEREDQVINNDTRLVGGQDLTASMNNSKAEISNSGIMRCTDCPQRGCAECPLYGVGENPEFVKRQKEFEAKRQARRSGGSSGSGGRLL